MACRCQTSRQRNPRWVAFQGHRPGGQGHRPGARQAQNGGRARSAASRAKSKLRKRQEKSLDAQGSYMNDSGRGRAKDYAFPSFREGLRRAAPAGSSGWKKWTAAAVLRAGFASESATLRQIAKEVEGGSGAHSGQARFVVARAITQGQEDGAAQLQLTSLRALCAFLVRKLMFDESSFDLKADDDEAACAHSISCAAMGSGPSFREDSLLPADCSWRPGQVCDDICRPPQSMEAMNSQTMWKALKAWSCSQLRAAMLVTCDAHAANLRLLRHLDQQASKSFAAANPLRPT